MLETALMLLLCLLVGLLSLAIAAWLALTGRILTLDGLALALIVLTLGGFFMFNAFWSYRTGELRDMLEYFRKKSTKSDS